MAVPPPLDARVVPLFLALLFLIHSSFLLLLIFANAPLSVALALDKNPSSWPVAALPAAVPTIQQLPIAVRHSNELGVVPSSSSPPPKDPSGSFSLSDPSQQMAKKTKATIGFLSSLIIYVTVNSLARTLNPSAFIWSAEDREEPTWIATSHSWLDRKACRWLGLCGTAHVQPAQPRFGHRKIAVGRESESEDIPAWQTAWSSAPDLSDQWDDDERARREIPAYVLKHAPLVHLFSGEQFWPGDIAEHLFHVTPMLNYTPIQSSSKHSTLRDLNQLNQWQRNGDVFLTSNDNAEDRPPWMEGAHNIPQITTSEVEESWADWDGRADGEIPGDTPESRAQWYDSSYPHEEEACDEDPKLAGGLSDIDLEKLLSGDDDIEQELRKRFGGQRIHVEKTGGRSNAPAVLLVIDKGNGIVDAFWFYFYSFNLGNVVFDVRFGNHIGDWEHCLVRFLHGKPKALFFSAHSAGEAYSYEAVEKIGRRPVIYSAVGTHAMYATPGVHSYILPWGLLHDQTDRGPLWDPLLNAHTYTYDHVNDTLRASTANPSSPTEWFYFDGHWGDKFYSLGDSRQYRFAGQYHYVNGPIGPRFKHLGRHKLCQGPDDAPCTIKNYIGDSKQVKPYEA